MERLELVAGYEIPRVVWACPRPSPGSGAAPGSRETLYERWEAMVGAGADAFDCSDLGSEAEELVGGLRRRLGRRAGAGADRLRVHTALAPDRDLLPKLTRQWVVDRIDRSLLRVGVDRLDLVQLHWWDFAVAGYVAAAQWLQELQHAGKIGRLGVANFDVPHLAKLLDAGVPVISNLVSYSLMDRRPENGMTQLCRERDVRLFAYGSLAGGFLSARYESCPVPPTSLADVNLTRYRLLVEEYGGWTLLQDLLDVLRRLAEKHGGLEPETVAARYVLERDEVAALVLGPESSATQVERLFTFCLDNEDYAALDNILSYAEGPRGDVFVSERSPDGAYASVLAPTRSERGW